MRGARKKKLRWYSPPLISRMDMGLNPSPAGIRDCTRTQGRGSREGLASTSTISACSPQKAAAREKLRR